MIRLLLADDEDLLRGALVALLELRLRVSIGLALRAVPADLTMAFPLWTLLRSGSGTRGLSAHDQRS
jgi:hypothetical protein